MTKRQSVDRSLVVINLVGLTPELLGRDTPNLSRLADEGASMPMQGVFPAVTTTAQASMVTGQAPSAHGIVGNGWYFRDLGEVRFWLQPDQLMQGTKVWQHLKRRRPGFRCSKLFWWYNMYADVDGAITPRPHYPADGSKVLDLYSFPDGLHQEIEQRIGRFPFLHFWGPGADIRSSRWIIDCAITEYRLNRPHLQLVYLPHLDYNFQRLGPDDPRIRQDLREIDAEAGRLIDFARGEGAEVLVVSEYGMEAVSGSVSINRVLREAGMLQVRSSLDWELLDCGASRAFAVADHQVAHVYVRDGRDVAAVKRLLQRTPGVAEVLDDEGQEAYGVRHPRSGELVIIAEPGRWFDYYYWLDDKRAPDFARTVDIHRKPGYDPAELFIDPALRFPKLKIAKRLLQKRLGQRMLMDVIPLDPNLVRGSHGRPAATPDSGPVLIAGNSRLLDALPDKNALKMQQVSLLMQSYFSSSRP